MSKHTSSIQIEVTLDEQKVPEEITWSAPDSGTTADQSAKAMLLAFFDRKSRDTLRIDLWTKDMEIQEMDLFFYQTVRALADTYKRATSNTKLAEAMQQFARYFGEEVELIQRDSKT